ncbi:putative aromatic peroxygenase [Podospora australis]|uniref:Aromatic peroxygenase n=1 Tax=Podospora australis TaxID=1536484 RepID=A0AAN6WMB9_9PEZI|nr:putative aromatic peroxygenase [Podospora australis]
MKVAQLLPFVGLASALPWMADKRQQSGGAQPGGPVTCPFNPDHKPAAKWNKDFPYNHAKNGLPGKGKGGYQVPAPGDDEHRFMPPTERDIRGPCPGLNALANHNFIARDGITDYGELLDALQNVYNVGYDLANFLAFYAIYVAGLGDPVTKKLSIGCDATERTSWAPKVTGSEPGLVGHSKMEIDASLTRNDFFPAGGDNFSFNTTLWKQFVQSTGGLFDAEGISKYRKERWDQCQAENPQFYFPILGLFQYGAASFLYELWPNGNEGYVPNLHNTATFFGALPLPNGEWASVPERIPHNWVNREVPYFLLDIAAQITKMYALNPVGFGGNAGGEFIGISSPPYIHDGALGHNTTSADVKCLLYQILSRPIPSTLNGIVTPVVEGLSDLLTKTFGKDFDNLGCPLKLT